MNSRNDMRPSHAGSELIVIGAEDSVGAGEQIRRVLRFIDVAKEVRLRDVALTCATQSANFPFKMGIVATSIKDLSDKLGYALERIDAGIMRNSFNRGIYIGTSQCPAPGRTVFLFPGEGTQYPDMMRELALLFPACRAAFDAADTAVASASADAGGQEWPLPSHYVFPPSPVAKERDILALPTPFAIQTVLAADTAMLFLFSLLGLKPDAVMGVGVGELVALECAGAVPVPSKAQRIRLLGEGFKMISEIAANRKLVPDCVTLSISGLVRDRLAAILERFGNAAAIAADQATELFTVAVSPEALVELQKVLTGEGVAFHTLGSITKPFHTPLMEPFGERFRQYYGQFVTSTPAFPVYSCATQGPIAGESAAEIAEAAARQWTCPLHVGDTIRRLYDDGFRVFVELGARGGLTACVGSTLRHLPHLAVASNRGHRPDVLQLNHVLAALVSHGAKFDATILHKGRDSRLVDFGHPSDYRPLKRARERPISWIDPGFTDVRIPEGLIAPAPKEAEPVLTSGATLGDAEFPALDFAEVVKYAPENEITLSVRLTKAYYPYLAARALSSGAVSAYDKGACGLMLAPAELLAELMAEAAHKLYPAQVVVRIEQLAAPGALEAIEAASSDILVHARRLSSRNGESIIEADIARREASSPMASCKVVLAASYPASPAASPLSLRNTLRAGWAPTDVYPLRLHCGECCRVVKNIPETGDNGLAAECFVPPMRGILRASAQPALSASPVCLVAASDSLALVDQREPASGILHIFNGAEKIEFFAPPLKEWTPFTARIAARVRSANAVCAIAEAELLDADHRVFMRISGLSNRVVVLPQVLHRLLLNPMGAALSVEVSPQSLPALPHEVVCRRVDDDWPDDDDEALRMGIAANLVLSPAELEHWNGMATSRLRRHEWLFGRIAAKDAVRKCLLARYGRQIGAADVAIETDEAGKPSPQGKWRRTCGALMDISITHTPGCIFAAAAPNATLGIDAERTDRTMSEDFADFAFSQMEREMAAESGDGAISLFRFWCAKEALSKALGSGLRYGPNDLSARNFDFATGKVEMGAVRLWLEAFPQLKGVAVPVQTCLLGDFILAVCALSSPQGSERLKG